MKKKVMYATYTDVGNRKINEDSHSVISHNGNTCCVVCDGLGGHGMGDVASSIAVDVLNNQFKSIANPRDFIAEGIQTNIRELEGALFRLMSYCDMHGVIPTIAIAKELLADILTLEEKRLAVNVHTIKKVVGKYFKIEIEDFSSKRKMQSIAWPRQIAIYLTTSLTDMSLSEIGREFNRDHSTVVHARDLVKDKIKNDPFFAAEINRILSDIKAVDNK